MTPSQTYDVDVELDTAPREVDVPPDLAEALAGDAAAEAFWYTLNHSKQSWLALSISTAKQAQTRLRRVDKAITMLREYRGP